MDTSLIKILAELPTTGAVIITVVLFIRFVKEDRSASQLFFRQIHEEHLDARKQSREAMQNNAQVVSNNITATERNTVTLEKVSQSLERLAAKIESCPKIS